jgi:hypothetical protein
LLAIRLKSEADNPMYMNVAINYNPEEVPSIEYRIKEMIIPEEER